MVPHLHRKGREKIYFLGMSTANKSPGINYGMRRGTQHDTAVINAGIISCAGVREETNGCGRCLDVWCED